jgi:hypothetical protein
MLENKVNDNILNAHFIQDRGIWVVTSHIAVENLVIAPYFGYEAWIRP